jgi:nucleoid-associated protein YgaU
MELEKATIEVIYPSSGEKFEVLFNPKEYTLAKSNQFTEVSIPGLSAPPLQFGRGAARTLSMQLFFDTYTYEQGLDVQFYTDDIMGLLEVDPDLHAPPVCLITWGYSLYFQGVLERANQRFTMFLADGTPVRATVDVSFKEFIEDPANLQSANYVKQYVVRRGDTLSAIAAEKYGDATLWRPIAKENKISDPLKLKPGQVLVIPAIE